jgi:DNA-binding CsgD family transcriptional regulator
MARGLTHLLDTLFASILEDPPWLAFLEALEHYLPCHHGTLVLRKPRDGDPGVVVALRGNAEAVAALQERAFKHSPFLELPEGKICILSEMMSGRELETRHPGYYEYLREFGATADLIGVDLIEPRTGMTFRLRGARRTDEPPFGEAERKRLKALLPRLQTAIALYARIVQQQYQLNIFDEGADQLALGSLVLDENGQVLLKNAVADRLLSQQDGLYLRDGRLHCGDSRSERDLRAALAGLRAAPGQRSTAADRVLVIQRGGDRCWSLLLRASMARLGLGENTAATMLVLVRDASQKPAVSSAMLVELCGLTRAEAALAVRLVNGESLNEAALALGISRYTARAQLASVFAKTDVHRQSQLVSHILATINAAWA